VVTIKPIFSGVTPYNLVTVYRLMKMEAKAPIPTYTSTRMHGVTSQKNIKTYVEYGGG